MQTCNHKLSTALHPKHQKKNLHLHHLALLSSEPVKVLAYEAPYQVPADGVLRDVDDHARGVLFTYHTGVQRHLQISKRLGHQKLNSFDLRPVHS